VTFFNAGSAVFASLAGGASDSATDGVDRLTNLENISGSTFGDVLTGNGVANELQGNGGNDTLTGGLGADTFVFATAADSTTNHDTVTDFLSGTDKLEFAAFSFTGLGAAGPLDASTFVLGTAALDAGDRLVYDSSTGDLFYDADGNGSGSSVLVASFGAGTIVAASDIFVV